LPNGRPIGVIQQPGFFEDILRRMGVNRPQQAFTLDGNVVPVVLVDSGVSFVAAPTPPYRVTDRFSLGLVSAPVIDTVLADTGPLPEGPYTVQVMIYVEERAFFEFEWRNAGNTADLINQRITIHPAGGEVFLWNTRFQVENANERFRILNVVAGGVGVGFQATIFARI